MTFVLQVFMGSGSQLPSGDWSAYLTIPLFHKQDIKTSNSPILILIKYFRLLHSDISIFSSESKFMLTACRDCVFPNNYLLFTQQYHNVKKDSQISCNYRK